jgi:hypothetical protein
MGRQSGQHQHGQAHGEAQHRQAAIPDLGLGGEAAALSVELLLRYQFGACARGQVPWGRVVQDSLRHARIGGGI